MEQFKIEMLKSRLKSLQGQKLHNEQKYSKADGILKEANRMFDQNLKEFSKIFEQGTDDLDVVADVEHELKMNYCINLYFIGRNLYSIDESFCETMLQCKLRVLNMYPDRRIKLLEMRNGNENLDSIESIVEEIKSTSEGTLDLSYLCLRPLEMKSCIVPAMLNNNNINGITKLDLKFNKIGDQGAKTLSQALNKMSNLCEIDLSGNKIGTEGMKSLWEPLRRCSVVRLDANNLTKDSSPYISLLLENNNKIVALLLHLNPLFGRDKTKF